MSTNLLKPLGHGIAVAAFAAAVALALPAQADVTVCTAASLTGVTTGDDVLVTGGTCTIDGGSEISGKVIVVATGILILTDATVAAIEGSGDAVINLASGAEVEGDVIHNGPTGTIDFTSSGDPAVVNGKVELISSLTTFRASGTAVNNVIAKNLTCNAFAIVDVVAGDGDNWDGSDVTTGILDGTIGEGYECFGPPGETGDDSGITAQQFVDLCTGVEPNEGLLFGAGDVDLGAGLVIPSGFELEVVDQVGPPAAYAVGAGLCEITLLGDAELEIGKFNRFAIVGDVLVTGVGVEAEYQSKEGVVWVITGSDFTVSLLSPEAEAQFEKNTCLWVEGSISITVGVAGPVDDDAELQIKEVTADAYDDPGGALFDTPCDDDNANIFSDTGSISLVSLGPDSETQIEKFNIVKADINITITSENAAAADPAAADGQTELKEGVRLIANTGGMGGVVDLNGAECILEEGVDLNTGELHMSLVGGFVVGDTLDGCDLVDTD